MKGSSSYSFGRYRPVLSQRELRGETVRDGDDFFYICAVRPGIDSFEVEYKPQAAAVIFYRAALCGSWVSVRADGGRAVIGGLLPNQEYEFYIGDHTGAAKSRFRLLRTGDYPGTVVNYLHPGDRYFDFSGRYLASPSILNLGGGRLLASMDVFANGYGQNLSFIFSSDDGGESWRHTCDLFPCFWGKLFSHRGQVYMLAVSKEYGDLVISRSTDGGNSFCTPSVLFRGSCLPDGGGFHKAPMPVICHGGRIITAMEYGSWALGVRHPAFLASCNEEDDLCDPAAWTLSQPLVCSPEWDEHSGGEACFLEGSLVAAPDGELYSVMRYHSLGDPRRAIILKAGKGPEDPESFHSFVDFHGGISKFDVCFDEGSGCYISIINRVGPKAENGRSVLTLVYSRDLISWEIAADLYDYSEKDQTENGLQYASFCFDGADLLVLTRVGVNGANNFHDSNCIVFDRIADFRRLLPKI